MVVGRAGWVPHSLFNACLAEGLPMSPNASVSTDKFPGGHESKYILINFINI